MCGRVMTENSCELDLLANRASLNDHNTLSSVVITIRLDENTEDAATHKVMVYIVVRSLD